MSIFKIPIKVPKRNKFNLSHTHRSSGKMGRIIPVLAEDCVPGEDFSISIESLFRFMPMVAPVMAKVKVKTAFYFVPNRIMCPTWEKFILADEPGSDTIAAPVILWQPTGSAAFTVGGYFGLPDMPSTTNVIQVSAYPFAAYHHIYEAFYRPQHLEAAEPEVLTPGNTNSWALDIAINAPISTNWALDYFTSALPYPQFGAEAVRIPIGGEVILTPTADADPMILRQVSDGALPTPSDYLKHGPTGSAKLQDNNNKDLRLDPNGNYIVDPNSAGTIDDLLRANALQNWLRRTARAGNRYVEQIRAIFGTPVQDARLQRPEFIGTVRQEVAFSEVLSTAETEAPIGQMAGHGISRADSGNIHYKTKEHGWIIGLLTVMPTSSYQNGVSRKWLREDRFDYLFPDFANIGERPIYNSELFADIPAGTGNTQQRGTWGYQPQYTEYKTRTSYTSGLMRNELDFWNLTRKFTSLPTLSKGFLQTIGDQDTFSSIFADLEGEHFVFQIYFKVDAWRPLPRFGVPTI